jgi:hypothetical protein
MKISNIRLDSSKSMPINDRKKLASKLSSNLQNLNELKNNNVAEVEINRKMHA